MRIAIQGEAGSFSEEAARQLFPRAKMLACATFAEAFESLVGGEAERALIPIENSLAGAVSESYDLLRLQPVRIVGEVQMRIEHNLIVPPGVGLKQIRRVLSHPVALQQCRRFLHRHRSWQAVPFYDTAGSVKHLMESRPGDAAAIAGRRAAQAYGARLLAGGIEDNKQNYTRFYLLCRAGRQSETLAAPHDANKISIVFLAPNQPGSLFKTLAVFALRDIDLLRIESRPIPGRPWEYSFNVDFRGNLRQKTTRNALRHLKEVSDAVKILGCYRAADKALA